MKKLAWLSAAVTLGLLAWPRPVHAYLDPGSGSLLLQFLIAGIIGAGVALKLFWGRLRRLFTGRHGDAHEDKDADGK